MSAVKRIVMFYDLLFASLGGIISRDKACKSLRINKLNSARFGLRVADQEPRGLWVVGERPADGV